MPWWRFGFINLNKIEFRHFRSFYFRENHEIGIQKEEHASFRFGSYACTAAFVPFYDTWKHPTRYMTMVVVVFKSHVVQGIKRCNAKKYRRMLKTRR